MLSPYTYLAFARERHETYLAQAEVDRRAKQARRQRRQAVTRGARSWPRRWHPAWLRGAE